MESIAGLPREGLTALDYLAVGGYLLITLAIVIWSLRRQSPPHCYDKERPKNNFLL